MSYMDWKAGDKVVCVETWLEPLRGYGDEIGPVVGTIYEIREIGYLSPNLPDSVQVRLCEITNKARPYRGIGVWEQSFKASRFRPVQTRKTSIEVFERLLTPSEHDKHLIEVHDFVSLQEPFQ